MSLTHATGIARIVNHGIVCATFSFAVLALLVLSAVAVYTPQPNWGSLVYGLSLVTCAFCSYIYTIRPEIEGSRVWRHLDHATIFLLIAGTYTPFAIDVIGPFGIPLIYPIWLLAIGGLTLRLIVRRSYPRLFIGLYVLIGWLFVVALDSILATIDVLSLRLLGLGALAYTLGAVIFARDIGRWTDAVWHAFVFLGAYLHFLAVLNLTTLRV